MLLNYAITKLPESTQAAMKGIEGVNDKLLVMKAQALGLAGIIPGLADALKILQKPPSEGGDVSTFVQAQLNLEKYKKLIIATSKEIEEAIKGTIEGGETKKNPFQEQLKAVQNQIAAYKQLRIAKIDNATASEIAGNAEMAAIIATQAGLKANLKAIQEYAKARKQLEKLQEAGLDFGDATIADLNRKKAFLDLQEKLITMRYSHELERQNKALEDQEYGIEFIGRAINKVNREQIRPIQEIIEENTYALEQIGFAEDQINEKYDKQEEALDNILSINEDIAAVQKSRISVADALTKGDISAAAQAIQDLKSQQRNLTGSNQRKILQNARKQEIAALRRNDIEETNKKSKIKIVEPIEYDLLFLGYHMYGNVKTENYEKYFSNKFDLFKIEDLNKKLTFYENNKFEFKCKDCHNITKISLSNGYLPSCKCTEFRGYSLVEEDIYNFLLENISSEIHIKNKDRKSTRLNSSHVSESRMPSSA